MLPLLSAAGTLPGMARTSTITREQYDRLFGLMKSIPRPSFATASRESGLSVPAVTRLWNLGVPSRGWPAIKDSTDGITERAKHVAAAVLAKADPTAFPLAVEDAFVQQFNNHVRAGEAIALARGASIHAELFSSLEPLATACADELKKIALAGLEAEADGDGRLDPFDKVSRAVNLIERLTRSVVVLQQGVRLHLGLPNEIVQHEIVDDKVVHHRLTLADKIRARLGLVSERVDEAVSSLQVVSEHAFEAETTQGAEFGPVADDEPGGDGDTQRVCIAGGPRTGKTTLARQQERIRNVPARHTDDTVPFGWSEASEAVSKWFDEPGPWIIEGVAVPRALRKWLDANPGDERPCDEAIFLDEEFEVLTPGQATMTKGVKTVWLEILPELERRGVVIS